MTTSDQDIIIEALAEQHGSAKVLPLRGTDAVLACGWSFSASVAGKAVEPWWYIPADPAVELSVAAGPSLRYAYEQEIADAHEQDAVRELLSAAGLRP